MRISLKSANETKYWICLLRDGLNVNSEKAKALLKEADEISKIIGSIVIKLKKSKGLLPGISEQSMEYLPF